MIRVMTFNIRCSNVGPRSWKDRVGDVCQTITDSGASILGVQEATPRWMHKLVKNLKGWKYVGVGRQNGKCLGEYSAVFYKEDEYELIDSGNFWYSDTPQKASRCWTSVHCRICSYAVLRERSTGKEFVHMNTHMDVDMALIERSVPILLERVAGLNDRPLICTGDFNSPEGCNAYKAMVEVLRDSKHIAPDTMSYCTFHNEKPEEHETDIIDFIFVNDKIDVKTYKVLNEKINGNYASDHFAVYADIDF